MLLIGNATAENSETVQPLLTVQEAPKPHEQITLEDGTTHLVEELTTSFPRNFWELMISSPTDFVLLASAILGIMVSSVIRLKIPVLIGQFMDVLNKRQASSGPYVEFITVIVGHAVLKMIASGILAVSIESMARRIKVLLFEKIITMDVSRYDSTKTGELADRLSRDVDELRAMVKHSINQGLRSLMSVAGSLVALCAISSKLALGMIAVGPLMVALGSAYGTTLRKQSKKVRDEESALNASAQEVMSNVRTVRGFAREGYEAHRFKSRAERVSSLGARFAFLVSGFFTLVSVAFNGGVLAALWAGGRYVDKGELSAGELASFMLTAMRLQGSVAQLSVLYGEVSKGLAASERILDFFKLPVLIPMTGGERPKLGPGKVQFSNVTFAYPSRRGVKVMDGFTLSMEPRKVTALVGPSGVGKSTAASLLERFYDPQQGSILLDGKDLRTLDPSWLRGHVLGIVSQEPVLFSATIKENLRYGKLNATEQEIIEAAKIANAHQFIEEFPDGYETAVGERGVALSGGQKQRIAIARAVLKNPSILILDEATSALDSVSEREVQRALERLMEGRTTLVIAHRLSTIKDADKIVVLNNGGVAEEGNHTDLMARGGKYKQLVQFQMNQNHSNTA